MVDFLETLREYDPKIVSIDVNLKTQKDKISKCTYYLLVDNQGFIHDYKIYFQKIYLTQATTDSHFITKKHVPSFIFREKIFKALKINHLKSSEESRKNKNKKENIICLNDDQIKIVNSLFDKEWKNQTFQNIIYAIMGSNPTGEGKKPSAARVTTFFENKEYAIGILLQSLNLNKKKAITFDMLKKSNYEWKIIDFEGWINSMDQKIKEYFFQLNDPCRLLPWKTIKKQISNQAKLAKKTWNKLNSDILKMRLELKKIIGDSTKYYINFWKNSCPNEIEIAHIKSVKQIKKEYLEEQTSYKKTQLLLQIKDLNNCLPIPSQVHKNFDSCNITWNVNGEMLIKKNLNLDAWLKDCFKIYKKIPNDKNTTLMKKFIEEHNKFETKIFDFTIF